MRSIIVTQHGGPEVLVLQTVSDPSAPAAGQILVKLEAIGVNPVETYLRQGANNYGAPLPWTPGADGAGRIEALGPGVEKFHVGQRVYVAGALTGTYAEKCLCTQEQVHPLPLAVSFEEGACIGVPAATAWRALADIAQAKRGETVLVHGASGGVGLAAVQIAKAAGLFVIGTASTEAGRKLVLEMGAHAALDHRDPKHLEDAARLAGGGVWNPATGGIHIVLEMLANVNLGNDLKWLAKGGRVVVIGSRGEVNINPRDLMLKDASIRGMSLFNITPADRARIHAGLGAMIARRELRLVVAQTLPLAQAADAHVRVMQPGAHGNVVMKP